MRNLLILLPLALLLVACPPGGGDDDDGGSPLEELDTNGDGVLDPDDLEPGEAAAVLEFDFDAGDDDDDAADDDDDVVVDDPEPEEGVTTTQVTLSPSSSAWYLEAVFQTSGPEVTVSLRFENSGEGSPALETGAVTNGNASPDDGSWYAYGSNPGGEVEIVASSATEASGYFHGTAVMDVLGEFEEPTGETVTITAFAFRDAPLSIPQ
jgi:hypothetical protein